MFNQMIDHYSPLFTSIKTMFGYKSSSLLGASIFSAISIEAIFKYVLHGSFMGVSALMIITVSFLILVDWAFGSAASRKIANEAKLKEDLDTYKEHKFSSIKISHTIFKFLSLFLWLTLSFSVVHKTSSVEWLAPFIEGIVIVPILLFGFREYISIGEAVEELLGYRPYLFIIGEKIFDALQLKFLNRFKDGN